MRKPAVQIALIIVAVMITIAALDRLIANDNDNVTLIGGSVVIVVVLGIALTAIIRNRSR